MNKQLKRTLLLLKKLNSSKDIKGRTHYLTSYVHRRVLSFIFMFVETLRIIVKVPKHGINRIKR